MKIVLLEPLGISADKLKSLGDAMTARGHEFVSYDNLTLDEDEQIKRIDGADVVIIANHPLSGKVIDSDPNLKVVSVAFVGIDHVDVEACKRRGIRIFNTGGYCDDAVAELAVGLTLSCLRNIPACDAAVQAGKGKAGLQGFELAGRTVGIIGTGAIGLRTAELFKAFHCKLIGYSRSERDRAKELGLVYKSLDDVMAEADIISVHTPLTPQTKGLIGAKQIAEMKQGAILVNTARGPVVDTDALAEALKANKICAGIDVYEKDPPLPADHPLLGAPNLVCTPHVGFDTKESIDRRADMVFENITAWEDGSPVRVML
ncbi:2-hydroxyacid dehydrogenase [Pseudoramibacter sp.]|jgi:D-3-phosphoglycerate dehydrogenase|uniref:2-hydroxyacid dehydrogenase n=1 Tax=Pseudoramibacter sp. TaxID=2034862 RepID=UPI0025FA8AF4|nr:2-hydroxyacid dehydrogenase [Pseudoramibacter sp.]MCH4071685.1 2-hydroxyacid dehydrogenase [Pseudoramibacter sp.]MCH4105453.1 2-hydroxyacid dehydrogenase [Pseudoramibacter sp.]